MDRKTLEGFKALGSNSEAKKMFALEYFVRQMERFEATPVETGKPDWAKGWVKRPAKLGGICSGPGCMTRFQAGDVVFVALGNSPRCVSCGEKVA